MKVRRFQPEDTGAIERLNERLRAHEISNVVWPEGIEQDRHATVRERLFVAADAAEVRGAVWLKEQVFRVRGEDVQCGWLKYPVAESLIDARYNSVPASLIMQCLREQPRLFALGLGGHETPLARMLRALRWTGTTVPMFVKVVRPARTLRQIVPARRTALRRAVSDIAALTGLGWFGLRVIDLYSRARFGSRVTGSLAERYDRLGVWADATWAEVRDRYAFSARRDAPTVEAVIPPTDDIIRLRVLRAGADVGWACVLRHDFSTGATDRNFGALTVGMIADGFCAPEHVSGLLGAAYDVLVASGVDIVFSNQLHPSWISGLRRLGFFSAPTNVAFYASPAAAPLAADWRDCHINRGDCDGPIWYDPSPWHH